MVPKHPANIESHLLLPDNGFPNNPKLPLLAYRQAIRGATEIAASDVKRLLSGNYWAGTWQNGVHPFHHFHSNAHEVLVVCSGRADIQFGGPGGPILSVVVGDAALLPAGTSHKCVKSTDDFLVVGAYPIGQEDYDMLRGDPEE